MTIVAAVDRSSHRSKIVEEGVRLANAFDEELHVVHVLSRQEFIDLEQTNIERTGQTINISEIKQLAAKIAGEALDAELNVTYETVGRVGSSSDEIVSYAENVNASYVVIGGRRRSPVGKAIMGSVTQSVLLSVDCPVVAVLQPGRDK